MDKEGILYSISNLGIGDSIKENFNSEFNKEFKKVIFLKNEFNKKDKNILYKFLRSLNKRLKSRILDERIKKIEERIIKREISKIKEIKYFFNISNLKFREKFFEILKENNPNIKTILFLWDKTEYMDNTNQIKNYDYIFSYDRIDALNNNFIFRPTFYIDECLENLNNKKEYDLFYIGVLRDRKRYDYLEKLNKYLHKENLNLFLKLYADKNIKNILSNNYDRNLIMTKRISYLENIELLKNSKVVLDIKYKKQHGLTLRCYEALATGTKIITDNEDIKNYDFYNENNIKIIKDINDIEKIPIEFFKTPIIEIDKKIIERYSIKGFIDEIFQKIGEKNEI
ncbi:MULTISPECIES: glycosyltransferase [Fusobacterium]|uniref:glycosyltransferase n=1 Tax=Fusobacterium TaxID=848 RepID=UPI001477543E|nr:MULTISPECIES: glycosyltransferase [Fusobacterium]NME35786.1 hypothetical protein [Fusobacterium sp. FSA-380-WT-3A]